MIDRACISINNKCNLRCSYCHFLSKKRADTQSKTEFNSGEVENILDNITKYCTESDIGEFKLGIVGAGEPLLSFDVLEFIVIHAKRNRNPVFRMYTISNGVALTMDHLRFFKEHSDIITLNFSLDGYEELHDAYRQGFAKTSRAILLYEKVFGSKPTINCTVTKQSVIHEKELVRFFKDNRFERVNFSRISDVADHDLALSENEYCDFLRKCEAAGIKMRQRNESTKQKYDCKKYGYLCGAGKTNVFFARNGVYPCGRFYGLEGYKVAEFDAKLDVIEERISVFDNEAGEECFYDRVTNQD